MKIGNAMVYADNRGMQFAITAISILLHLIFLYSLFIATYSVRKEYEPAHPIVRSPIVYTLANTVTPTILPSPTTTMPSTMTGNRAHSSKKNGIKTLVASSPSSVKHIARQEEQINIAKDAATTKDTPKPHSTTVVGEQMIMPTPSIAEQRSTSNHSTTIHTQCHQSVHGKRRVSLADVTRSYIAHIQHESNTTGYITTPTTAISSGNTPSSLIAKQNPRTLTVDGTAFVEYHYAVKLFHSLEQAARTYTHQIYAYHNASMETMLEITIGTQGELLRVTITPSIAEKDLETALYTIVKRVGLFPPIPKKLNRERLTLCIPITITSTHGFAHYQLLCGFKTR